MHRTTRAIALFALATPSVAAAEEVPLSDLSAPSVAPFGYAEVYYQHHFGQPENGITNARGFDNRAGTFTLSNVALGAELVNSPAVARLVLQVGSTPATYYAAEPALPAGSAASATDASLWQHVQEAKIGYRIPLGEGLTVVAGVFLSPIGPEAIPVYQNLTWSRSNLFFGLPFYHTGATASYPLGSATTATIGVWNGWNSVVDGNDDKSFSAQVVVTPEEGLTISALYFGGVERPEGAPEGRAFRSLFDTHVTWQATEALTLQAHLDGGFEPNDVGTSGWIAGALAGRARVWDPIYVAWRGDVFVEHAANDGARVAAPMVWSVPWLGSGTATVEARLVDHVSFRLELRHDRAGGDLFYEGAVSGDGVTRPFEPNARAQTTLTLGGTAWL